MSSIYPFNSGSPKYVYQWDNTIGVYPTPTEVKTIRIHYVNDPTTLQGALGSVTPDILTLNNNQHFADSMILYATAQIMRRLNPQAYQELKSEWYAEKDKFISGNKLYREEVVQSPHKDF